jgi:hypothetical protein
MAISKKKKNSYKNKSRKYILKSRKNILRGGSFKIKPKKSVKVITAEPSSSSAPPKTVLGPNANSSINPKVPPVPQVAPVAAVAANVAMSKQPFYTGFLNKAKSFLPNPSTINPLPKMQAFFSNRNTAQEAKTAAVATAAASIAAEKAAADVVAKAARAAETAEANKQFLKAFQQYQKMNPDNPITPYEFARGEY